MGGLTTKEQARRPDALCTMNTDVLLFGLGFGWPVSDVFGVLSGQVANLVTEFEEQLFPALRLSRGIAVEAIGIRDASRPGLNYLSHEARNLGGAVKLGEKVFHHSGVGGDSGEVHEAEGTGEGDPVTIIIPYRAVNIGYGGVASFHKVERLAKHGIHDSVGNEAADVSAKKRWLFSPMAGEANGLLRVLERGILPADDLHEPVDIGWLPPVQPQNALGVLRALLELRDWDGGGVASDKRSGGDSGLDSSDDLALHIDTLDGGFNDNFRVLQNGKIA